MTSVALVAIIALAAGGLIVVMLAIATRRGDAMPAPSDAPSSRETSEAATARAQKPPRRAAWHGITQAWTSWRHRRADDLLDSRARGRRRALYKERASWLAAGVAFSVVLAYLIAHI